MTNKESFENFESDINNYVELIKEDLNDIKKDIIKNKNNTVATLKAILNMEAVASDINKTSEIYFNSSVSQNFDKLKNKPELKKFIVAKFKQEEKGIKEVKEKRGITREADISECHLKSGFHDISELFGNIVEYFAIVKNIAHAANIPEYKKPGLILENLNSMLTEILSIEITVKDNINTIILNEINKEEPKIKKVA
jgi:hypothetical protein